MSLHFTTTTYCVRCKLAQGLLSGKYSQLETTKSTDNSAAADRTENTPPVRQLQLSNSLVSNYSTIVFYIVVVVFVVVFVCLFVVFFCFYY